MEAVFLVRTLSQLRIMLIWGRALVDFLLTFPTGLDRLLRDLQRLSRTRKGLLLDRSIGICHALNSNKVVLKVRLRVLGKVGLTEHRVSFGLIAHDRFALHYAPPFLNYSDLFRLPWLLYKHVLIELVVVVVVKLHDASVERVARRQVFVGDHH